MMPCDLCGEGLFPEEKEMGTLKRRTAQGPVILGSICGECAEERKVAMEYNGVFLDGDVVTGAVATHGAVSVLELSDEDLTMLSLVDQ